MYTVTSPAGCTVTDETGLQLGTVEAGEQKTFVATGAQLRVDDDAARVTLTFNRAASALGLLGGGDTKNWDKYALCKDENDFAALWGDASVHAGSWIADLSENGEWRWNLTSLERGYYVFSRHNSFMEKMRFFTTPSCPVMTDASSWYGGMFFNFENLEKCLCEFPALKNGESQGSMFQNCKKLWYLKHGFPKLQNGGGMLSGCILDKGSAVRVLISLPAWASGTHKLTIGIHVDHQSDEEVVNAIAEAEAKGWTLTVQWNGTATAAAATTWGRRKPVFARLGEPMEDGTPTLDWGHYVTDPDSYTEFASLEEAKEHFNITE